MLQMALLFLCLSATSVKAADDYVVTIESNGKLKSNKDMIFKETNVGPGFYKNYKVTFVNNYKDEIRIFVEKITVDTTAPSTNQFKFTLRNGNSQMSGAVEEFKTSKFEVITVSPGSNESLDIGFHLFKSAGNEYQNTNYSFYIKFRIESDDMVIGLGNEATPVKTGDNTPIYFWIGAIVVSAILLILILKKHKRSEEIKHE